MECLLIGVSRIALKRILPALEAIAEIDLIHLASRRPLDPSLISARKRGNVFQDYGAALRHLQPGTIAYVSLPNSLHAEWAENALTQGFHVIVDKPLCVSLESTKRLLEVAALRDRCLAEAIVWQYHPQIEFASQVFRDAGTIPACVNAVFSMPPLDPNDFRYDADLGGGSLLDLGPYAVSSGRVFFGNSIKTVTCRAHILDGRQGVDTSFSVMIDYVGGGTLVGYFGFTTEYSNSLSILSSSAIVRLDRAFTLPADMRATVHLRAANQSTSIEVPSADSFQLFLRKVLGSISAHDWSEHARVLKEDAESLHKLRTSAGVIR